MGGILNNHKNTISHGRLGSYSSLPKDYLCVSQTYGATQSIFQATPTTRDLISHVPNKKEMAHVIWLICKKFNKGLLTKEWARRKEINEGRYSSSRANNQWKTITTSGPEGAGE